MRRWPFSFLPVMVMVLGCSSRGSDSSTSDDALSEGSPADTSEARQTLITQGFRLVYREQTTRWIETRPATWGDRYEHDDGRVAYVTLDSNDQETIVGPVSPGKYEGAVDRSICMYPSTACWEATRATLVLSGVKLNDRTERFALSGTIKIKGSGLNDSERSFGVPMLPNSDTPALPYDRQHDMASQPPPFPIVTISKDGNTIESLTAEVPDSRGHSLYLNFGSLKRAQDDTTH